MAEVEGPSYGLPMNTLPPGIPTAPTSQARFSKTSERRGPGYAKLHTIETPEDVMAFSEEEISPSLANGVGGNSKAMKLKINATTNGTSSPKY